MGITRAAQAIVSASLTALPRTHDGRSQIRMVLIYWVFPFEYMGLAQTGMAAYLQAHLCACVWGAQNDYLILLDVCMQFSTGDKTRRNAAHYKL